MAAQELVFKISATNTALRTVMSQTKAAYTGLASDVTKIAKAEAQSAIALQRQRSSALISIWKAEQREQVRLAKEAQREIERAAQESQRRRSAFISGALGGLTALVGVSAISELRAAGAAMIDYASKLETTKIAFTTMMGSADLAAQHLKDLQQFALKTPFQFGELIDASQRMQALGFNAQQVIPILTDVGNAVAAAGGGSERLDRVVLALSQIQSKGKVATQELNQLAEAGISGWKILEAQLGKSRAELVKMVEAGQISSAVFLEAFQKFSKQNFGGLMEQQSKTFSGAMSNIKDALLQTSAVAFEPLYKRLSETAQKLGDLAINSQKFKNDMKDVGEVVAAVWDAVVFAVKAGTAVLVGVMTALSGVVQAVAQAFMAAWHSAQAFAAFSMGDFARAKRETIAMEESLNRAMIDVNVAAEANKSIVQGIGRAWREAGASAAVAVQQMVTIDTNNMVGAGILRQRTPGTPPPTTKATKTGSARDPMADDRQLLKSLQDELIGLTDKTKAAAVAQELLNEKYRNSPLAEAIKLTAQMIDVKKADIAITKQKEAGDKALIDLTTEWREAVNDARLGNDEYDKSIRRVLDGLIGLTPAEREETKAILERNAALMRTVALTRERIVLEQTLIERQERQRAVSDEVRARLLGIDLDVDKEGTRERRVGPDPNATVDPWKEALGNLKNIANDTFGSLAQGIGGLIQNWVLLGTAGPGALRKMVAAILASAAAQASVEAIMELAYAWKEFALASASAAVFDVAGAALHTASAHAHLLSAAVFGAVGVGAAVAGRVIAGNSGASGGGAASSAFKGATSSGSGTSSSGEIKPTDVNRRANASPSVNVAIHLHGDIATDALKTKVVNAVVEGLDLNDGRLTAMIQTAAGRAG